MPDVLFDRERTALAELRQLIEERRHGEDQLAVTSSRLQQAAVAEAEEARKALANEQQRELAELDAASEQQREELVQRQAAEEEEALRTHTANLERLENAEHEARTRIGGELRDALWLAESISEGGQKRVQEHLTAVRYQMTASEERSATLWKEVEPLLARFDLEREDVEPAGKLPKLAAETKPDPEGVLSRAETLLRQMQHQRVLPWARKSTAVAIGVVAFVLGTVPAAFLHLGVLALVSWLLSGIMGGFLAGLASHIFLYSLARRRLRSQGRKLLVLLAQARDQAILLVAQTEPWAEAERAALQSRFDADRRKAQTTHRPKLEELTRRLRAERADLEQQFKTISRTQREHDREALEAFRRSCEERRSACVSRQEKARRDSEAGHAETLRNLRETRQKKARHLRRRWETEAGRLLELFTEFQHVHSGQGDGGRGQGDKGTRGQGDKEKETREPSDDHSSVPLSPCPLVPLSSSAVPLSGMEGLTLGTLTVDVRQLAGEPPDEKLAPLPSQPLVLPAFLPFPRLGGLLLHAFGEGRTAAVRTLQALMLRLLTSLPPGKVRFTIFDPVGLGDNFAAFMHLADHDESLVSSRIWTEPAHLEKQLADLTVHMENVIQRYLRSEFKSIEDYNARAGEVAEPYRVLVVANFPVNFTPQAARRLVSILQSGSSCGVYALVGLDTRQPLPQGFQLDDLEQLCLNLYWRDERFHWGDAELDRYPLTLETPPEATQVIETVRKIGLLSRDANRVRVPFSFIAPAEEEIWKGDSRHGVSVPLGRLGAVKRLSLELGKGTSQHVLVAGKTGSGKSTLWHALIANLALRYSPDEVELYLIDFKKGVEFKLYALHQLPHARVIAIESEREFGLSVLQRLDAELRQRGDLFRAAGVNDLAGYRDSHPDDRCPRILLIVDEFQEFFVEDDRLSQEAALLLDRLVRQGRAFGLHILLGSQTLGGAYSLARSTIDQMAVRIALQCSEADAQLILNKDNSAARLLSRPGEAIYNDANGALEGNEVFQVVWLPEEEREQLLETVSRRTARELPDANLRRPLVFEGNTPAELDHNPLLKRLLEPAESDSLDDSTLRPSPIGRAWLGEAIAIKEPTAAVFRPQTGDNVLVVGQNDEVALALLSSALVSLAAQQPLAQFLVLDGTAPHQPHAGFLKTLMEGWPQPMILSERAGLPAALATVVEELNQRLKGVSSDRSVRYVLINGLQSYREFRRSDDDMGFGRRGAERTLAALEQLQALLRDGPVVGIHVLMWCDTLVNVMRSLDRPGLRECGQRVLFQMSAADSSHLLDSPLASRLGRNRALYYTDELGQPEKFRPYGLPSLAWLTEVKRRLAERGANVSVR